MRRESSRRSATSRTSPRGVAGRSRRSYGAGCRTGAATSAIRLSSSKRSSRSGSRGRSSACSSMSEVWSAEEHVDEERARRSSGRNSSSPPTRSRSSARAGTMPSSGSTASGPSASLVARSSCPVPSGRSPCCRPSPSGCPSACPRRSSSGDPGTTFPGRSTEPAISTESRRRGTRSTRLRWARRYARCTHLRRSLRWVRAACRSARQSGHGRSPAAAGGARHRSPGARRGRPAATAGPPHGRLPRRSAHAPAARRRRRAHGIVDWVDVCRSDPAVDLSVAWSTLDAARRPAFFAAYGVVDEETRVRARVVAASSARCSPTGRGRNRCRSCVMPPLPVCGARSTSD